MGTNKPFLSDAAAPILIRFEICYIYKKKATFTDCRKLFICFRSSIKK